MANQVSNNLEPWCDLNGKVVMVTGASSGLGRDICLDLSKAGCMIVATARRIDRLKSLCDEINVFNVSNSSSNSVTDRRTQAVAVELDITADGPTIDSYIQKAWDAFGRIDALVNNAGIRGNVKSPLDLTEEEWSSNFKTNLTGSWLVSKYVCIRMRDAGQKGSVINISSVAGLNRGQALGSVHYSSSKAGVNAMTQVMAMELGVHKIRVNAIAPGLFKSEITQGLMQKDWLDNVAKRTVPLRTFGTSDPALNVAKRTVPLRTFGTSDPALTSLVRYLIHDSTEYVSGNIFIVNAGALLAGIPIFSSL